VWGNKRGDSKVPVRHWRLEARFFFFFLCEVAVIIIGEWSDSLMMKLLLHRGVWPGPSDFEYRGVRETAVSGVECQKRYPVQVIMQPIRHGLEVA
jgi:hypothetical protein